MNMTTRLFCASLLALAAAPMAAAQTIQGSLTFGVNPLNYFNPANGYVPTGYGNTAGTSVLVGNGIEFGFSDGSNLDTADFTATGLTITNVTYRTGTNPFQMIFTASDPNFFSNLVAGPDSFGGTYSLSGNTLTFNAPAFQGLGTRSATFSFGVAAVPEPGTWALMLLGFGAIGASMRRQRRLGALAVAHPG